MNMFVFTYGGITYIIPEGCRSGLELYISDGIFPGGFLSAIIENDFVRAAGAADVDNMANLPAYANFLYNYAPSPCWGSPEKMAVWISHNGVKGDSDASPNP